MGLLSSKALILRTFDYSETSQIVWFYTREFGRLHAIAKGSRRARSEFEGALEPLTELKIELYRKEGRELDILSGIELINTHPGFRRSYERLVWASQIAELLAETAQLDDPNPDFYDLTHALLKATEQAEREALPALGLAFEARLLQNLGFFPQLKFCVETGKELKGAEVHIDVRRGGVISPEMAGKAPRIRTQTLRRFEALASSEEPWTIVLEAREALELRELLNDLWTAQIERPLRMGAVVADLL